jgi:hypothetical protein
MLSVMYEQDEQLPAPLEQVGQTDLAGRPGEPVVLGDLGHRQPAALGRQRVPGPGELLLLGQQVAAGGPPFLRRHDFRLSTHARP